MDAEFYRVIASTIQCLVWSGTLLVAILKTSAIARANLLTLPFYWVSNLDFRQ
jgi:hypothetical protein